MIRLLILGVLAWAAWTLLRQLLEEPAEAPTAPGVSPPAQSETRVMSGNGADSETKAELYREAQRLGVEGRSKMTKAELARAIERVRQPA